MHFKISEQVILQINKIKYSSQYSLILSNYVLVFSVNKKENIFTHGKCKW